MIQEFRFTNATVHIVSERLGGETSSAIPDIVLHDIGRKRAGVTAAEAGRQIMSPLMRKVLESAGRKILEKEDTGRLRGLLDKARGGG